WVCWSEVEHGYTDLELSGGDWEGGDFLLSKGGEEEVKGDTPIIPTEEVKRGDTPIIPTEEVKRGGTPIIPTEEVKRGDTPIIPTEE
ncbi:hypothetical protein BgiMline_023138, partial [Biomphalaria glabrata]